MFQILATPLGWLLSKLYAVVGSYGITIAILTVLVKLVLYPLYKKQILSTAGMSDVQSKVQALQKKYASDQSLLNEKIQELYKEEGISPTSGCLPMLVQMIVIMGLFALLRNPMTYLSSDDMYFAIHEEFLWIRDLSQPDPWILPLLAGVATFFSFWLNQQTNPTAGAAGSNAMMKGMQYFFPIMIVWLARTYPSGLAIYWFLSQFIQIFYNLRFNKLKEEMKNSKKAKKEKK